MYWNLRCECLKKDANEFYVASAVFRCRRTQDDGEKSEGVSGEGGGEEREEE